MVAGVITDKVAGFQQRPQAEGLTGLHGADSRVSPVLLLHRPATDTVAMVIIKANVCVQDYISPRLNFVLKKIGAAVDLVASQFL